MAINKPNRIMVTLNNGEAVLVHHNTLTNLDRAVVLNARNEIHTKEGAITGVYRFSDASTGFFLVLNEDDDKRLENVLEAEDGALLLKIIPIKSYGEKDLTKAKPFKKA